MTKHDKSLADAQFRRHSIHNIIERDTLQLPVATLGSSEVPPLFRMRPTNRHGTNATGNQTPVEGRACRAERPLQYVELDECMVDLHSFIHGSGHKRDYTSARLEALGLAGEKVRGRIAVARDRRTRVILGMKFTRDLNVSPAAECFRMVLRDKKQWADAAEAVTPWSQAGIPEKVVIDHGLGVSSLTINNTCMELGIKLERKIARGPSERGLERIFWKATINLKRQLRGRTFGDDGKVRGRSAERPPSIRTEDVTFALTRWVVDIYHNTPQAGLGGRTPLQQWEADTKKGN